jgi:hypothetical protein
VHFTETCEADAPHLIVEVLTAAATTPDGQVVGDLHEQLAEHDLLPKQHLVDMGYVDAEVLAQSQTRYHIDLVGPVPPDLSWLALGGPRLRSQPVCHGLAGPPGDLSSWAPQSKLEHASQSPWEARDSRAVSSGGLSAVSLP